MEQEIKISELLDPERANEHLPALQAYFEKGGTWQMLMNLPDFHLESQYANGYELYQEGRYKEATEAFTSLTILNPYEPKYWFALAAARHLDGDLSEALQAYLLSSAIDEENPTPLLQAARCADELERAGETLKLLDQTIAVGKENGEYEMVVREARALKERAKQVE